MRRITNTAAQHRIKSSASDVFGSSYVKRN